MATKHLWWISLPYATGLLETEDYIVKQAPPYFRRYKGTDIARVIGELKKQKGFIVKQVNGDCNGDGEDFM